MKDYSILFQMALIPSGTADGCKPPSSTQPSPSSSKQRRGAEQTCPQHIAHHYRHVSRFSQTQLCGAD